MTSDTHSVLVVTKDSKISVLVSALMVPPMFDLSLTQNFNEARRMCQERVYNIVLVDFADGEGTDFAIDISDSTSTVLLLAPSHLYEQISYKVEPYGILTVSTPFDQFNFYSMIKAAIAVQYKVQILSSQTIKLKEKMEEIRVINRAKLLLMEKLSMTEMDAHHHIEKQAMDTGSKKRTVAEDIIRTYG
ncbi:MAG: ANTAR domain-containing protein [Treponema sp.]|nr:ANTAR domain-containing protein [Candidatus Treponema equifaecale]